MVAGGVPDLPGYRYGLLHLEPQSSCERVVAGVHGVEADPAARAQDHEARHEPAGLRHAVDDTHAASGRAIAAARECDGDQDPLPGPIANAVPAASWWMQLSEIRTVRASRELGSAGVVSAGRYGIRRTDEGTSIDP
jgi:hypothetical protein